jgi:hypothetical protein
MLGYLASNKDRLSRVGGLVQWQEKLRRVEDPLWPPRLNGYSVAFRDRLR